MLPQEQQSGSLIEILDIEALFMPTKNAISGRSQSGEEEQGAESFEKNSLIFP